jgi:hypothetical protein
MTWTAPDIKRVDEHFAADERTTLEEFPDWYRAGPARWASCSAVSPAHLCNKVAL